MQEEDVECQFHENCGAYCETPEEIKHGLCEGCLDSARDREADEAALKAVRKAVQRYYAALDRREHGGVAMSKAFDEIQQALGMNWVQGATLSRPKDV